MFNNLHHTYFLKLSFNNNSFIIYLLFIYFFNFYTSYVLKFLFCCVLNGLKAAAELVSDMNGNSKLKGDL